MAYHRFDIDSIFASMSEIKEDFYEGLVTFNNETISYCYPGASFPPKDIEDNDYWKSSAQYLYHMAVQQDFDYPNIPSQEVVHSIELLDIELAKIRYDFMDPNDYINEYKKIFDIASCALIMYSTFKGSVGGDSFETFYPDFEHNKIKFMTRDRNEFEIDMDETMKDVCNLHKNCIGLFCGITETNRRFYARLPFYPAEEPAGGYELEDHMAFRDRVIQAINEDMQE